MHNEPIRVQVVIPFHQPLTATDEDMEQACLRCYLPLLDALERSQGTRLILHFTGHLLDYLARTREEFLLRIKGLMKRGQVEVLGGLFYGGIPALLPELDVRGQIQMAGEFWDSFLGVVPKGFWLSELAWTPELPRLLEESGLEYGFVSNGQLDVADGGTKAMGVIERGGQSIAAFVLDSQLSQALPSRPVDEWVDAVVDRASSIPHRMVNVWVRAESLGLEPGTARWCLDGAWLKSWFSALGGGRAEIESTLAQDTYPVVRPAEPLRLRNACAPEISAYGLSDTIVDWTDFPWLFMEVDTIYRRMLRASDKLREAIGIMEDDELEETWSDKLATAQRHVFAAQSPDAYWRGALPGFSDPATRDATMARLLRAEAMIDALVQGEDDWVSTEEEDRDGDLVEEVFVANRHLLAWVVPARGADIRTLDDRAAERNVLDVGGRRSEPFFATMERAPRATPTGSLARRGENLPRLEEELPTEYDDVLRRGIRQWIFEDGTSAAEFFSGSAVDLIPPTASWDVLENGIDEDGDCSYGLALSTVYEVQGIRARSLQVEKRIGVPIDAPELRMSVDLELSGEPAVLWATEIPTRLGQGPVRLWVDGKEVTGAQHESHQVEHVRIEAGDGEAMELTFEPRLDIWWKKVRTSLRSLEGYRAADQGLIVVPTLRVDGRAAAVITIKLIPGV